MKIIFKGEKINKMSKTGHKKEVIFLL